MKSIVKMNDVWKRYPMGKTEGLSVLKEVYLDIKQGEFVAITGPSGSGKSTMMHLVGALDVPSYGNVYLDEKNISSVGESSLSLLRSKKIGFIFQQFNLIPTLNALQNVMLPMELIDVSEESARKRAENLLKMLGLGERMHHKPSELSGGQQQRVAIARSLANNPEIILADEPTGNLDSKTGTFVMDFLGEMHEKYGKTIILVTHDLNLVHYAKRVIHIKDGRIEKEVENKRPGRKRNGRKNGK